MVVKSLARNLLLSLFGTVSRPKPGVHILNSHYLSPGIGNPNIFYNQLKQLKKNTDFILFEEAVDLIKNNVRVKSPLIAFSYDDGFEECYTQIAPVIKSFGINAAFFINPNFISGMECYHEEFLQRIQVDKKSPMTWRQILDLKKQGHIIGSHTMDHINLGNRQLKKSELEYQLRQSKKVIESQTGAPCTMMAFPFGQMKHFSVEAMIIAEQYYEHIFSGTNYKFYFSCDNRVINRRHCEPFWPISHVRYFLSTIKQF